MENVQNRTASANVGSWFSRGWEMISADLSTFILLALIYLAVIAVASSTVVGGFLVSGPLTVGFMRILFDRMRGKPIVIGDLARGFDDFLAAVLSSIVISAFTALGTLFCIIPGLVAAAWFILTPAVIAEKHLDFWQSMEASRLAVQGHTFEVVVFIILLAVVNLAGALACFVGLLVTVPLSFAATACAYDDLVGINRAE